jgi:hypothetical protein
VRGSRFGRARLTPAVAVLAAFAASFRREFMVLREAALLAGTLCPPLRPASDASSRSFEKLRSSGRTLWPPSRPASAARLGSFAKFPPLALPSLPAISFCFFSSIEAKPRFEDWS